MAIDFEKFNREFGGKKAVEEMNKAKDKEFPEIPDGKYICTRAKLELGESNKGKPMVKGQFKIKEGKFKNQLLFYNGVMVAEDPEYNGFVKHNVLSFLRSLDVFDEVEIDFDGNYEHFNDLLLDIAEESEVLTFEIKKYVNKGYDRLECTGTFED